MHRHLCASCEAAGTSFMLSKIYVNRCSSDIKRCFFFFFFFLFNRFNFFAEMYSPSGKRNAELFCSSFFCLVLVDFVFLAAVCLGLLCTILKPFTAFSEHFLTECRTLHLHLSIQRLRIGLCHSVNDPVMIWFMSLSFSHHSLIFCFVF